MSQEAKWYVVHTYSGYENKVKEDLEKSVENLGLQDTILEVKYPTEEVIEILPNGKRKVSQRKVFPGYVMVKMVVDGVEKERPPEKGGGTVQDLVMNPRAWYVVRNARGVTGFVGPGSKPIPLSDEEVTAMGVERIPIVHNIEVGENVRVSPARWRTSSAASSISIRSGRRSSSPFPCSAAKRRSSWILYRYKSCDVPRAAGRAGHKAWEGEAPRSHHKTNRRELQWQRKSQAM